MIKRRDFLKIAGLGIASALVGNRVYADDSNRTILTFDDKPFEIERTARLVEILKENGFENSQFYLTGFGIIEQPESTKYIADNGFDIGWHSMRHDVMKNKSPEVLVDDFNEWKKVLDEVVPGYEVKLGRFPYGSGTREQIDILGEQGLSVYPCVGRGVHPYNWDVDTEDWNPEGVYSVEKTNEQISRFKNGNPIVLFHQRLAKPYQKKNSDMPAVTESLIVGDMDKFEKYVKGIRK